MSGSLSTKAERGDYRRQLLTTVSAFALIAMTGTAQAAGSDADNPPIWIEFDGQLADLTSAHELFAPLYTLLLPRPYFETRSAGSLQSAPRVGWDAGATFTFRPEDTDWVFSAAAHYGRVQNKKHQHEQALPTYYDSSGFAYGVYAFDESTARNIEGHVVLDFRAGKDVGMGIFGGGGNSVFSLGVRYASFDAHSDTQLSSHPSLPRYPANLFHATEHIKHSFSGIGPSVSWDASAPFAGTVQNGSLWIDWGANAAILFGKQSVRGNHQTLEQRRSGYSRFRTVYNRHVPITRSHTRSVTDLGGYAAISYRLESVKLSVGYRADMFFGAIDGGIDMPKMENRDFYGPFASVSIGIGD